jgi:hypothetical protein
VHVLVTLVVLGDDSATAATGADARVTAESGMLIRFPDGTEEEVPAVAESG